MPNSIAITVKKKLRNVGNHQSILEINQSWKSINLGVKP